MGSRSEYLREWRRRNPARVKANRDRWRLANPERQKAAVQKCRDRLKAEVFEAYGNKCACCGERNHGFFTIDHISGDGNEHRKKIGQHIYLVLKREGFPKDRYQLLCWNCNCGRAKNGGVCPHKDPKYGN